MWESKVDGSAWGPSFCHLFLMTYGKEIFSCLQGDNIFAEFNKSSSTRMEGTKERNSDPRPVPKIFGFQIHPAANVRYPTL